MEKGPCVILHSWVAVKENAQPFHSLAHCVCCCFFLLPLPRPSLLDAPMSTPSSNEAQAPHWQWEEGGGRPFHDPQQPPLAAHLSHCLPPHQSLVHLACSHSGHHHVEGGG